uniref:LIM zinc-binding domain-containing protein n=1 Tax=Timema bartmani TaxID=61472 RepID=A0A7R9I6H6_9NEOP|nr:unnamed protein product [Timema bartmani]
MLKDREATGPTAASPCGGPEPSVCGGCGGRITDRYYLLAVDRSWHSACLKCCECKLPLDSELTCFARDGNIYCKEDYYRLFAVKRCGRCQAGISASELVMRARDLVYHLHCFTCVSCGGALSKGDHFGMKDGLVYCRPHYEQLLYTHEAVYCGDLEAVFGGSPAHYFAAGGGGGVQKGRPRKRKLPASVETADLPVAMRIPAAALGKLTAPVFFSQLDAAKQSKNYHT